MRISDWSSDVCSSDLRIDIVLIVFVEDRDRAQRADIIADSRGDLAAPAALKTIVGMAQVVAARRAALAGHAIAAAGIAAGVGARRGAAQRPRLLRAQEGVLAVDRLDLALAQGRGVGLRTAVVVHEQQDQKSTRLHSR